MVFRYDPMKDSYHQDMEGDGVVCSAVDIFPTEFAKRVPFIKAFCSVNVIIFRILKRPECEILLIFMKLAVLLWKGFQTLWRHIIRIFWLFGFYKRH